jgi:hypothetical protein
MHQRCNTRNWVGRIDVASPWKGGARNWVGRRVVASTRKGGANERVCDASLMQHYGTGKVDEMLHHRGTAELGTG